MSRHLSLFAAAVGLLALVSTAASANSGRDKLTRGCEQGRLYDCVEVGVLWENGDRGPQDYEQAVAFFTRACDGKEALGCHHLARLVETGNGVEQDTKKAVKLYTSACDIGYLGSCTHLARLFRSEVALDLIRARYVLGKACTLGDGPSCYDLGLMWQRGEGGPKNLEHALGAFLPGCETQDARCCLQSAVMYRDGLGAKADRARAQELLDQACTYGGERFCSSLEDAGGDVSLGRCVLGADSLRCAITALQRDVLHDRAKFEASREFYTKACGEGRGAACHRLAMLEQDESPAKARDLFAKGCDAGAATACNSLGFMHAAGAGGPEDTAAAHAHFVRACKADDALGCFNQAVYALSGTAADKDPTLAATLFERACGMGEPTSCHDAAVLYTIGHGVAKDEAKGLTLLNEACSFGLERSCAAHKAHSGR